MSYFGFWQVYCYLCRGGVCAQMRLFYPTAGLQQIRPPSDEMSIWRCCCTPVISLCLTHKLVRNWDSSAPQISPNDSPPLLKCTLKLTLYEIGSSVRSKQKGTAAFDASFLFLVILLWDSASVFLWRNLPLFYHNQDLVCFWHGQNPVDNPRHSPDRLCAGDPEGY